MQRETTRATSHILPFELDGHRFGLLADDVVTILRAATPSPLPAAPAAVLGVLNVHDALVPVFDIRSRFGLKPRRMQPADHLIVVRAGARTAAIAVETAEALLSVPAESFRRSPMLSVESAHVAGVVALPDGTLVVYDLAKFLTEAEEIVLDKALATGMAATVAPG